MGLGFASQFAHWTENPTVLTLTLDTVDAPGAATVALVTTGTGNCTNGAHSVKVTFTTSFGETELGTAGGPVTVDGTHKQIALTAIPTGPTGVVSRKVYMTKAAGSRYYLVDTIADNSTTTYTINVADSSLGTDDETDRLNTTGQIPAPLRIYKNSVGTAQSEGLFLVNDSEAVLGTQQYSPVLMMRGYAWETTNGTSQSTDFGFQVRPIQGTSASAALDLTARVAGGSWSASPLASFSSGGGLTIGGSVSSTSLSLTDTGTAKSNLDMITMTNNVSAADMDGTSTSILWNQYYYDVATPAVADMGRIGFATETDWLSTGTTQDSYFYVSPCLDGTLTERFRVASDGDVTITQAPSTGTPTALLVTGGAHSAITQDTEDTDVYFNLTAAKTWVTRCTTATQRDVRITPRVYATVSGTITDAFTFYVDGPPTCGGGTITNPYCAGFGGTVGIIGTSDAKQFIIKANATQAIGNSLLEMQKSDGTVIGRYHSNDVSNVFLGVTAGSSITSGVGDTLVGRLAGGLLTTGGNNTLVGDNSGYYLVSGDGNTGCGVYSLFGLEAGASYNTAIGYSAGLPSNWPTAPANSTAIGANSWFWASNQVVIGDPNVTSTHLRGDVTVLDISQLGSESLTNGSLTAGTSWSVAGGDCTLAADAATWAFSGGAASTLTQASGTLAVAGVGNRWYKFIYSVSSASGSPAASITTAFAASSTSLDLKAGNHTTYFKSATTPGDFVITSTLTAGQAFTLDALSLVEIQGGDLQIAGPFVAGGTVTSGVAANTLGKLVLYNATSAHATTIQPGAAAAAVTYTWPTNVGAPGTVLTDAAGNGTLSWATAASGWTNSSGMLYPTTITDKVGVGASSKLSTLTVQPRADTSGITGTTTVNASTTVVGSGTAFLSELGIGDRISVSSAAATYATVTAIASDTSLTVDTALGNGTSQTINRKSSIFRLNNSAGSTSLLINDQGQTKITGTSDVPQLVVQANGTQTNSNSLLELRDSSGTAIGRYHATVNSQVFIGTGAGAAANSNTSGLVAIGYLAGASATSNVGISNVAVGIYALNKPTGARNVAVGPSAMQETGSGSDSVAIGNNALYYSGSTSDAIAIGNNALVGGGVIDRSGSIAIGTRSLYASSHTYNIAIGYYASTNDLRSQYSTVIGTNALTADAAVNHTYNTVIAGAASWSVPAVGSWAGAVVAGGSVDTGAHYYRVSFVVDGIETGLSDDILVTTTAGNNTVNHTAIPTYTGSGNCTARKLYRSKTAVSTYRYYLVDTAALLADNVTTTYTDAAADASLGAENTGPSGAILLGYGAVGYGSNMLVAGSSSQAITNVYLGSGNYSASPSGVVIHTTGGSGADNAGASLTLAPGAGTGTAAGGSFIVQTAAAAGGSSSAANTLTTRLTIASTGTSTFAGTVRQSKGANITAANDMVLTNDGNLFLVTGSTQINGLTNSTAGTMITLYFQDAVTVKHNTAPSGGFGKFLLAGASDFSATADDTLTVVFDGTYWRECARTAI